MTLIPGGPEPGDDSTIKQVTSLLPETLDVEEHNHIQAMTHSSHNLMQETLEGGGHEHIKAEGTDHFQAVSDSTISVIAAITAATTASTNTTTTTITTTSTPIVTTIDTTENMVLVPGGLEPNDDNTMTQVPHSCMQETLEGRGQDHITAEGSQGTDHFPDVFAPASTITITAAIIAPTTTPTTTSTTAVPTINTTTDNMVLLSGVPEPDEDTRINKVTSLLPVTLGLREPDHIQEMSQSSHSLMKQTLEGGQEHIKAEGTDHYQAVHATTSTTAVSAAITTSITAPITAFTTTPSTAVSTINTTTKNIALVPGGPEPRDDSTINQVASLLPEILDVGGHNHIQAMTQSSHSLKQETPEGGGSDPFKAEGTDHFRAVTDSTISDTAAITASINTTTTTITTTSTPIVTTIDTTKNMVLVPGSLEPNDDNTRTQIPHSFMQETLEGRGQDHITVEGTDHFPDVFATASTIAITETILAPSTTSTNTLTTTSTTAVSTINTITDNMVLVSGVPEPDEDSTINQVTSLLPVTLDVREPDHIQEMSQSSHSLMKETLEGGGPEHIKAEGTDHFQAVIATTSTTTVTVDITASITAPNTAFTTSSSTAVSTKNIAVVPGGPEPGDDSTINHVASLLPDTMDVGRQDHIQEMTQSSHSLMQETPEGRGQDRITAEGTDHFPDVFDPASTIAITSVITATTTTSTTTLTTTSTTTVSTIDTTTHYRYHPGGPEDPDEHNAINEFTSFLPGTLDSTSIASSTATSDNTCISTTIAFARQALNFSRKVLCFPFLPLFFVCRIFYSFLKRVSTWCFQKYVQYIILVILTQKIISYIVYTVDLSTDIFSAYQLFLNGAIWGGRLTILFTILPMLIMTSWFINAKIPASTNSESDKCNMSLIAIVGSPFVPSIIILWDIVTYIRSVYKGDTASVVRTSTAENEDANNDIVSAANNDNDDNTTDVVPDANITDNSILPDYVGDSTDIVSTSAIDNENENNDNQSVVVVIDADNEEDEYIKSMSKAARTDGAGALKLCEALVESYPQAGLQMFYSFVNLCNGLPVEMWQILGISTSFIALAWTVTHSFLFYDAALSSRLIFFFFGFLVIVSRLMVCCVYSMVDPLLFFVPNGTMLAASIIMWLIIRLCRCMPLVKYLLDKKELGDTVLIVSSLGTAVYNGFTMSGMVVSVINLLFAVGGFYLDIPQHAQHIVITTVYLSSCSLAFNVMFAFPSYFKSLRRDWLNNKDDGENFLF